MKALFVITMSVFLQTAFAESADYRVNPGDVLEISVWNEDDLQRELRVLPDGSISFPLCGSVNVAGKTLKAIKSELTQKLSDFIADPEVNVGVKSVEGNVVHVLGQVKNPGQFVMYRPMDVMQALSLAGGLTAFAKANDIIVLRRNETGQEAIEFEYGELESGDDLDKNHLLQSGDVIVVP